MCGADADASGRDDGGDNLVDRRFDMQIYPDTARTRTSEISAGAEIVLARAHEIRRAGSVEGALNSESSAVTAEFVDSAALERHFKRLGTVDLGCMMQTEVGYRSGMMPRGREKIRSFWHEK